MANKKSVRCSGAEFTHSHYSRNISPEKNGISQKLQPKGILQVSVNQLHAYLPRQGHTHNDLFCQHYSAVSLLDLSHYTKFPHNIFPSCHHCITQIDNSSMLHETTVICSPPKEVGKDKVSEFSASEGQLTGQCRPKVPAPCKHRSGRQYSLAVTHVKLLIQLTIKVTNSMCTEDAQPKKMAACPYT